MSLVTETMDSETVRDRDGNLLYVEYLVTTWDRTPGKDDVWVMSEQIKVRPSDVSGSKAEDFIKQKETQQIIAAANERNSAKYRNGEFE